MNQRSDMLIVCYSFSGHTEAIAAAGFDQRALRVGRALPPAGLAVSHA